jgi:predicted choloylglycine hydrolase
MLRMAAGLADRFPPDHLAEIEAMARAAGFPRDLLIFANVAPDLRKLGCSALLVEPAKSATGGPLFGRNLDWPPVGNLPEYTHVVVRRPAGKRAFAAVGFPGLVGVVSGMNDAGLAVADLSVTDAADGSPPLDLAGTPYTLALRRVLEECDTVADAERLLRGMKRTVRQNVAVCDKSTAAVFEITPTTLAVRPAERGLAACTNHFRTAKLAGWTDCPRFAALDDARSAEKLTVADVWQRLGAAHQGANTLQAMVFEPAAGRLHLAFGPGPATRLPRRLVDLGGLFAGK